MTTPKPKRGEVRGGSGTAWLVTALVGSLFAIGMTRMIAWQARDHVPGYVSGGFWWACGALAVLSAIYALTVASRRRPATYGVEPLTIAERRKLAADAAANGTDDRLDEPAAL